VNNELERMWKGPVVAQFAVLSQHFVEGLRKTITKTKEHIQNR
jgi:hypothetical protein